jgi:hypothetical protein
MKNVAAVFVLILGLAVGGLFLYSGYLIQESGNDLTTLRSQSGTSVAEAYYQEIGRFGIALSYFAYACGGGIAVISIGVCGLLASSTKKV